MNPRSFISRVAVVVAVVVAGVIGVSACGSSSAKPAVAGPLGTPFVGKVSGTNAFVSLAIKGDKVWAYVCDGEGKKGDIANYLVGSRNGDALSASDDEGAALTATFTASEVDGTVTLPGGAPLSFKAPLAAGQAGWFALNKGDSSSQEAGSWIRLPDGQVRGKVVVATTGTSDGGGEPTIQGGTAGGTGGVPPGAQPVPDGALKCYFATKRFFKAQKDYLNAPVTPGQLPVEIFALGDARTAMKEACGL